MVFSQLFFLGVIVFVAVVVVYFAVCLFLLPHNVKKLREEMKVQLDSQNSLLEKILEEATRHTNATFPCPSCKTPIVFTDGRGTCESCGQRVKA